MVSGLFTGPISESLILNSPGLPVDASKMVVICFFWTPITS
uniref:Uncharacterized protein n=1 Tax=Anguilla anguilla TaxID=7936 RepID=A0A0E9UCS1_ANGAN